MSEAISDVRLWLTETAVDDVLAADDRQDEWLQSAINTALSGVALMEGDPAPQVYDLSHIVEALIRAQQDLRDGRPWSTVRPQVESVLAVLTNARANAGMRPYRS